MFNYDINNIIVNKMPIQELKIRFLEGLRMQTDNIIILHYIHYHRNINADCSLIAIDSFFRQCNSKWSSQ